MLRLEHITFSCDDPARLAEFWGRLLDYETAAAGDSWLATDPRGEGTRLLFNRMAKSPTIVVPSLSETICPASSRHPLAVETSRQPARPFGPM